MSYYVTGGGEFYIPAGTDIAGPHQGAGGSAPIGGTGTSWLTWRDALAALGWVPGVFAGLRVFDAADRGVGVEVRVDDAHYPEAGVIAAISHLAACGAVGAVTLTGEDCARWKVVAYDGRARTLDAQIT